MTTQLSWNSTSTISGPAIVAAADTRSIRNTFSRSLVSVQAISMRLEEISAALRVLGDVGGPALVLMTANAV